MARITSTGNINIGEDVREEARLCIRCLDVEDAQRQDLETALAVLMELSMVITVEPDQILVDGEPFTIEEIIDTAVDLTEEA